MPLIDFSLFLCASAFLTFLVGVVWKLVRPGSLRWDTVALMTAITASVACVAFLPVNMTP